jgi:hypothetical protein
MLQNINPRPREKYVVCHSISSTAGRTRAMAGDSGCGNSAAGMWQGRTPLWIAEKDQNISAKPQ